MIRAIRVTIAAIGLFALSSVALAQCVRPERVWDVRPHSDALVAASGALAQMLKVLPDDAFDKPAAIVVSYDSSAVATHFITVLTVLLIMDDIESQNDKGKVALHFNRVVDAFMQRSSIAVDNINSYVVQMRRPAMSQQVLAVRDKVVALRTAVAKACVIAE